MVKISATRLIKIMRDNFRNVIIEFVITEMAMLIQATQGLKNQQQLSFKDLIVLSYYHII